VGYFARGEIAFGAIVREGFFEDVDCIGRFTPTMSCGSGVYADSITEGHEHKGVALRGDGKVHAIFHCINVKGMWDFGYCALGTELV
jgi:hypothetical protein